MNLLKELDQDIDESFKKVISNGWKLRKAIMGNSEESKEIVEEHNRLQNYYEANKFIKETFYSNTTPSGKIDLESIKNDLNAIEIVAVNNEIYELAHIAYIYQNKF